MDERNERIEPTLGEGEVGEERGQAEQASQQVVGKSQKDEGNQKQGEKGSQPVEKNKPGSFKWPKLISWGDMAESLGLTGIMWIGAFALLLIMFVPAWLNKPSGTVYYYTHSQISPDPRFPDVLQTDRATIREYGVSYCAGNIPELIKARNKAVAQSRLIRFKPLKKLGNGAWEGPIWIDGTRLGKVLINSGVAFPTGTGHC